MTLRIAHFTDVHFTRKPADFPLRDLVSKRGVGWLNLTLMRRFKRFQNIQRIVEALIKDLDSQELDQVLFTGDLTAVAYRQEFATAALAFKPLLERDDVFGIPGNHDVYVKKADGLAVFETLFANWYRTDRPDLATYHGFPRVRLLGEHFAIVAVQSVRPCALHDSSGLIGRKGMKALEELLTHKLMRKRRVVLALHYGLMLGNGKPDRRNHALRDARGLLNLSERLGVDMVVHGHIHERFVMPVGAKSPVLIANAGSLTDAKHSRSYHVYELGEHGVSIEVRRYQPDSQRFEIWPEAEGTGFYEWAEKPVTGHSA